MAKESSKETRAKNLQRFLDQSDELLAEMSQNKETFARLLQEIHEDLNAKLKELGFKEK